MPKVVAPETELDRLLEDGTFVKIPKVGDVVHGIIVVASKSEVRIDIDGLAVGVVRGEGLYHESDAYADLKPGDEVEATVLEIENENGEMELSFREAGFKKTWSVINNLIQSGEIVNSKVAEANKGGLMVLISSVPAFLPVSQLAPEHYPRIQGGDKQKILEKLRQLIGKEIAVKVIDADPKEEKVIVSEKAVWEDTKKKLLEKYGVGQTIKGTISAITNFGAFVQFDDVEGLIHISELTWERINHPSDVVKSGDTVEAQIIEISGPKIFLSVKRLTDDPWKGIEQQLKPGTMVKGKVTKVQPYGLVIEITPTIHGLAHISMLSDKPVKQVTDIAKLGDEVEFEVVEVNPGAHRLALKIPGVEVKDVKEAVKELEKVEAVEASKTETKEEDETSAVV